MRFALTACLISVVSLEGCSSVGLGKGSGASKAEFDKKLVCSNAAQRSLQGRGDGDIFTSKETYVQESFYSPKRNSCIAILILMQGDYDPLPSGQIRDTVRDSYAIVDTLSYQVIKTAYSGTGADRDRVGREIDKEVTTLKER